MNFKHFRINSYYDSVINDGIGIICCSLSIIIYYSVMWEIEMLCRDRYPLVYCLINIRSIMFDHVDCGKMSRVIGTK